MNALAKSIIYITLLAMPALTFADQQVITLQDGSQIKGELVGISNGTYTVKTPLLGEVHIQSAQVASISNPGAASTQAATAAPTNNQPTTTATNPDLNQKIQAAQSQLLANPAFVTDVQALAQDPEIMQLLSDPALVQAVTSKDVNALQNNPRGQALMNNPKMKALIEKLRGSSVLQ